MFRVIADRLDEAGLLRGSAPEADATLYAIAGESTYLRMTDGAGLPADDYAPWLAATISAALIKPAATAP